MTNERQSPIPEEELARRQPKRKIGCVTMGLGTVVCVAAALAVAEGAWAESLLQLESSAQERDSSPYDEQIFTELSPILDSPDAIKLPEDQLLTD